MTREDRVNKDKKRFLKRTTKRNIFCACVLALPVLQFLIFYVYINFNSFILAFQSYRLNTSGIGYITTFAGFDNFKVAISKIAQSGYMFRYSLIAYACSLFIGITFAMLFSFYLYKKSIGSEFFRVILFLPQIIASIALVLLYKTIVDSVYPEILRNAGNANAIGLLSDPKTKFTAVLVYNVFMGFGVNVLLFSGAMSGINQSIVESAKLDGAGTVQEFIHITIPMIYPTLVTFIVVGMAGVFTNQMNLLSFFGADSTDISTIGYFLYTQASRSDLVSPPINFLSYSQLSAMGIILTLIVIPLTLITRKLLEKLGPSAD